MISMLGWPVGNGVPVSVGRGVIVAEPCGVAVTVPLFDRRQGPIAQASAQAERNRMALEGRVFELERQLDAAYRQYELSRTQVVALETRDIAAMTMEAAGAFTSEDIQVMVHFGYCQSTS